MVIGMPEGFKERVDGYAAMKEFYDFRFKDVKTIPRRKGSGLLFTVRSTSWLVTRQVSIILCIILHFSVMISVFFPTADHLLCGEECGA